jgi:microcystin-dependent protein
MTASSPNTRIDARVVSAIDLSVKAYIPRWTSLEWSEQLNDVGSGTIRIDFKDPFIELFNTQYGDGALFNGTYAIQVLREGTLVFTFLIEDADVQRSGYLQEAVIAGRGIGAQLDWAIVLPQGYHAGMNIVQPTGGTDITYDREILSYEYLAQVATTANLSAVYSLTTTTGKLTASANGSINDLAIDGVTDLIVGSIILVKNQTDAKQNGIYYVSVVGNAGEKWVLEYDSDFYFNENFCYVGGNTYVQYGTTQKEKVFRITACPTSESGFSSTNITFAEATDAYTAIALFYALFREADEGVEIITTKGPTWGNQNTGYGRGGSTKSVDWALSLDATLSANKGLRDSRGKLPKDGGLTNLGRGQSLLQTIQTAAEQTECDWYVSPTGVVSIARKPTVANPSPIGTDRTTGSGALLLPLPLAESSQTKTTTRETRTVAYGTNGALIDVAQSSEAIAIAGRREFYAENSGDDDKSATNIATTALSKIAGAKLSIDIQFIEVDGRQAWLDFSVGDKILVEYEIGVFAERIVSGISGNVDSSFNVDIQLTLDEIIPDAVTSLQNQSIYGTSQASILRATLNNNRGSIPSPRLAVEPISRVSGMSNAVSLSWNESTSGRSTSYEAQVYRLDGVRRIVSRSRTSNVATVKTDPSHDYQVGDRVTVTGMTTYDVTDVAITAIDAINSTFSYANDGTNDAGGIVTGNFSSESAIVITAISKTNGLCTATTSRAHGLEVGEHIIVSDTGNSELDGFDKVVIAVPSSTTFTYSAGGIDATSSTGRLKPIAELRLSRVAAGATNATVENLSVSGGLYYTRIASINQDGNPGIPADPTPFFSSSNDMEVVGGAIRSPNYVAGSLGWRIASNGFAEFSNVTVRGTIDSSVITGGQIDIGGSDSTSFHVNNAGHLWSGSASLVSTGDYSTRSPFYVLNNGSLFARSATISGEINASSGTFTGTITATGIIQGGTFNGGDLNVGTGNTSAHIGSTGKIWAGNANDWGSAADAAPFRVNASGTVFANNIYATANRDGSSPGIRILANGAGNTEDAATGGSVFIYNKDTLVTRIGISDSAYMNISTTAVGNTIFTNVGGRFGFGTTALSSRTVTVSGDAVLGAADSRGDLFSIGGFSGPISGYSFRTAQIAYGANKAMYLCNNGSSAALKNNISALDTTTALAEIMTLTPKSFTWKHEAGDEDPAGVAEYKALDYDRGFVLEDFDSTNYQFVVTTPTEAYFALSEAEVSALDEVSIQNTELFEASYWKESAVIATSVAAIQELKGITDLIQEAADGLVPIGTIQAYAGDSGMLSSDKWLFCSGDFYPISLYQDLYDVLTAYGTVFPYGENIIDEITEEPVFFYVPNLSKRVPVGFDYQVTDADFDSPGNTGGAKTHTLTSAEMPSHSHQQQLGGSLSTVANVAGLYVIGDQNTSNTASTGGGGAHNNMQPYIVMHYIIKCK